MQVRPSSGAAFSIPAGPLEDRMMLVAFPAGGKRLFDTKRLEGPVFRAPGDERIFRNSEIHPGTITRDGRDIDIAPETVYRERVPYGGEGRGAAL